VQFQLADLFQSTLPVRGATVLRRLPVKLLLVSIHAPGEGSDPTSHRSRAADGVSIHAPGEGSDLAQASAPDGVTAVSIHAPGEGSDSCLLPWGSA